MVRDAALVDDLLPYQRSIGDQFMAFPASGDLAEPWPHAAARAHVAGVERRLGPAVALTPDAMAQGRAVLKSAGVPDNAWFVGLHIREGGFHGDGAGSTRAHRSSDIASYLPAVREITARGGWVIRLGDSSMSPFPAMPGVFDYARSPIKSAEMDVFLLAAGDLFIGTTSGLTSAAQIFRKPMLLVNCISNDAQYWTDCTSFIPKPVFDTRQKRYLSLVETYRQPVQALLIDGAVMQRHSLEVHANSAEDIRVATVEKLQARGGPVPLSNEDEAVMAAYRTALSGNPFMFGAATPSLGFLKAHPEWIAPPEALSRTGRHGRHGITPRTQRGFGSANR
jgi:putative glycosyltransferase (TIGR04372 family)